MTELPDRKHRIDARNIAPVERIMTEWRVADVLHAELQRVMGDTIPADVFVDFLTAIEWYDFPPEIQARAIEVLRILRPDIISIRDTSGKFKFISKYFFHNKISTHELDDDQIAALTTHFEVARVFDKHEYTEQHLMRDKLLADIEQKVRTAYTELLQKMLQTVGDTDQLEKRMAAYVDSFVSSTMAPVVPSAIKGRLLTEQAVLQRISTSISQQYVAISNLFAARYPGLKVDFVNLIKVSKEMLLGDIAEIAALRKRSRTS